MNHIYASENEPQKSVVVEHEQCFVLCRNRKYVSQPCWFLWKRKPCWGKSLHRLLMYCKQKGKAGNSLDCTDNQLLCLLTSRALWKYSVLNVNHCAWILTTRIPHNKISMSAFIFPSLSLLVFIPYWNSFHRNRC